jgi:hypothetical protein
METRGRRSHQSRRQIGDGNDPKGYIEADWSAAEGWKIGDRIKDQSWQQLALAWAYVGALCNRFGVAALSGQRVRRGR